MGFRSGLLFWAQETTHNSRVFSSIEIVSTCVQINFLKNQICKIAYRTRVQHVSGRICIRHKYLKRMCVHVSQFTCSTLNKCFCGHCLNGKMKKLPFSIFVYTVVAPLHIVNSDVWDLALEISINDYKYTLFLLQMIWLAILGFFYLNHKFDMYHIFVKFSLQLKISYPQRSLYSGDEGDFVNDKFNSLFISHSILYKKSCAYIP